MVAEPRCHITARGTYTTRYPSRAARMQKSVSSCPHEKLSRSEEHTSELQSRLHLVCLLLLGKKRICPKGVMIVQPTICTMRRNKLVCVIVPVMLLLATSSFTAAQEVPYQPSSPPTNDPTA